MLYSLNLHSTVCQLYLNNTGRKINLNNFLSRMVSRTHMVNYSLTREQRILSEERLIFSINDPGKTG